MSVDFDTLINNHSALVRRDIDNTIPSEREEESRKSQLTICYLLLKLCKANGLGINQFISMAIKLFLLFLIYNMKDGSKCAT